MVDDILLFSISRCSAILVRFALTLGKRGRIYDATRGRTQHTRRT